jgi:hypothetical protein
VKRWKCRIEHACRDLRVAYHQPWFVLLCGFNTTRRTIMAKGQQRKNKEVKKPKKKPTPAI